VVWRSWGELRHAEYQRYVCLRIRKHHSVVELALGLGLILLAPAARLPAVVNWYERVFMDPYGRIARQIPWLYSHYQVSRKVLRIVLAPFLFLLGLAMVIGGVEAAFW